MKGLRLFVRHCNNAIMGKPYSHSDVKFRYIKCKALFFTINRSRIPLPPKPTTAVKPCKKKEPKTKKRGSKEGKCDKNKSRKLIIKEGKTVNDSKASGTNVGNSIDSEAVGNVGVSSTKDNSVTKGNKRRKETKCDMAEAADGTAGKSNATVKKEKKIKKLFGKKQTTTSRSSIPDDDTPELPPKTPERTFGKDGPSFPKPPPTSARVDEKKEIKSNTKREEHKVAKKSKKVEEIKTQMTCSPLEKVGKNKSYLRNKNSTDDGIAQNRAGQKYGREEIWAERRPNDQDDDHDEPLYGDERDEKPKTIKKTQREDWEQRKRAFQKRTREESWAEKRPVDDGEHEDDDDIYAGMNPYKDDDADDKVDKDENIVDNINNNEANVTKIESDKTRINNWEKVDTNDEDNSEENEADITTAFEDEKPKAENEEDDSFTQDNEIRIGNIAHSLDIDEMDSEREQDQGNEDDNHDYDDINDDVNDVENAARQPLESADILNYKPNYFVNSYIQMRADTRRKMNKNKNNEDKDRQVEEDEDNSYYDKLYAGFNWDDPFHPNNIRPGLELCPVIVSNKGLGSRWPLRIERYID